MKKHCQWQCSSCGDVGSFDYYSEEFAASVIEAQHRGHIRRKPGCAAGVLVRTDLTRDPLE